MNNIHNRHTILMDYVIYPVKKKILVQDFLDILLYFIKYQIHFF
jgi:hypothetical protein